MNRGATSARAGNELACLAPRQMVQRKTMEDYLALLEVQTRRSPGAKTAWVAPSRLLTQGLSYIAGAKAPCDQQSADQAEIVVFPALVDHPGGGRHWAVLCAHPALRFVQAYDPLGYSRRVELTEAIRFLDQTLSRRPNTPRIRGWRSIDAEPVDRPQGGAAESGPFVVHFLQCLLLRETASPSWDPVRTRKLMTRRLRAHYAPTRLELEERELRYGKGGEWDARTERYTVNLARGEIRNVILMEDPVTWRYFPRPAGGPRFHSPTRTVVEEGPRLCITLAELPTPAEPPPASPPSPALSITLDEEEFGELMAVEEVDEGDSTVEPADAPKEPIEEQPEVETEGRKQRKRRTVVMRSPGGSRYRRKCLRGRVQ